MRLWIPILISFSILNITNAECPNLIQVPLTTYECDSPGYFTPTCTLIYQYYIESDSSNWRKGSCNYRIEPTLGNFIRLFDVYWDKPNKIVKSRTQDNTGPNDVFTITVDDTQHAGGWFSWIAYVRLSQQIAFGYFTFKGWGNYTFKNTKNYPSTWTIDMNPKLYVCSEPDGVNSVKCTVGNIKISYEIPSIPTILWPLTGAQLIARYNMNQYNGYSIPDSTNLLGPAFLGASTSGREDTNSANRPIWLPHTDPLTNQASEENGIKFTQSSQYVTLPSFQVEESVKTGINSFAIKMWIKLSEFPTVDSYLFRYSSADLETDYFALKLFAFDVANPKVMYGPTMIYFTVPLELNTWNVLIARVALFNFRPINIQNPSAVMALLINNKEELNAGFYVFPLVHDSPPVVRLGGPPSIPGAIINGVEIYSPGALYMPSACDTSTCKTELGQTSPSTCILPQCHFSCKTCFGWQENACLSCDTGYGLCHSRCLPVEQIPTCTASQYPGENCACQDCITGCQTCFDGSTCDVCYPEYKKRDSKCVIPEPELILETSSSDESSSIAGILAGAIIGSIAVIAVATFVLLKIIKKRKARTLHVASNVKETGTPINAQSP